MAASVSQAETYVQLLVRDLWGAQQTNLPAMNTTAATALAGYNGDEKADVYGFFNSRRKAMNDLLTGEGKRNLDRAILDWLHAAGPGYSGDTVDDAAWLYLREYLDDKGAFAGGSKDTKYTARGWTRGSVTHNGTPDMNIYRITTDRYAQAIASGWPQVIRYKNISAAADTSKIVRFWGGDRGRDLFDVQGSGRGPFDLTLFDDLNSNGLIKNVARTFSQADGTSLGASDVTNWTLSGTAAVNKTNLWGTGFGRGTGSPHGIKFTSIGAYMQQTLIQKPEPGTPYLFMVWVYPAAGFNAASGTCVVTWGSQSQTFTGLTDSQWNLLVVDRNSETFTEQWDTSASGANIVKVLCGVAADGLTIGPMQLVKCVRSPIDFMWYAGSNGITKATPLNVAINANGSITDTISAAGKHQHMIGLLYDTPEAYLPETTGGTTNAD